MAFVSFLQQQNLALSFKEEEKINKTMKPKRGKRSEQFWPSIMMKKWLNIQPKEHEFSEDEVDTEPESEDDVCSVKDSSISTGVEFRASRMQRNQPAISRQNSDFETVSKGYKSKHRRGKSEMLRVQYINTKDVRVRIGTWNVAGRIPGEDLEIHDWLCKDDDPAHIYIIGLQEVVPLSAGNVLGAEDNKPIPKWEAIIRRTLNKSSEPETKHKSYSAPSSPVMRASSEEIEARPSDLVIREHSDVFDLDGEGFRSVKNMRLRRIYGIDCDRRLDWPERSLDSAVPQELEISNSKLRRVLSSSARIGFSPSENPIAFPKKFALGGSGLKRCHQSSGNLGLMWTNPPKDEPGVLEPVDDDESSVDFIEEDDTFDETPDGDFGPGFGSANKSCRRYVRMVSKQMVGIYVSVWVCKTLRRHVNNLKVFPVGIGLMGYLGNKGSVSVSMSLYQSRLCFVCSHLTSGQKEGAEQKRNSDVYEIIRRTRFSSTVFDSEQPQTIPAHDQIFWFGDLNYRLNILDAEARKLIDLKRWDELVKSDQLTRELRSGRVFEGWREGVIGFPPTYKYDFNSDRYVGENPKEGEKKRSPAWCDRILWLGKGIKQLSYERAELKLSDHRPVSSTFVLEVEVLDQRKLQRAINFTNSAAVHPEIFSDIEDIDLEY